MLSLGATPLANALLTESQLSQSEPHYPLDLVFCPTCTLVQITETVPPPVLFSEYVYFSSFSDQAVEHARTLAERYRLEFVEDADKGWAFFGTYIDVVPSERIVWTNEEGEDGAISTVTFVEKDGKTRLTFTEVYPSKEALDESLGGMEGAPEQFAQLDELLVTLIASRA